MIEITAATPSILSALRNRYLDSLAEPQDLHSENRNAVAHRFLLWAAGQPIGYFFFDAQATLVEFYALERSVELLRHVIQERGLKRAICKSFDIQLMQAFEGVGTSRRPIGWLFRKVDDEGFDYDDRIRINLADERDLGLAMSVGDDFFRNEDDAALYIAHRGLFLYSMGRVPVGCGVVRRVIWDRTDYDIGMSVVATHRRKGLGTYIARHLKHFCLGEDHRPIAGCRVDNVASKRALERAGFRSEHQLFEVTW
jgi:RimJ/RimL family protein N-acetyltransferase